MGFEIKAFIANNGAFDSEKHLSTFVTVADLQQDYVLLLNDWYLDEALKSKDWVKSDQFQDMRLAKHLIEFVEQKSLSCAVAYVEIDFHGGSGYQYAVVWEQGKITFLPSNNGWVGKIPNNSGPINAALRKIGVKATQADEFISVGLGKHRNMVDWFVENTGHDVDEYYPDWMA